MRAISERAAKSLRLSYVPLDQDLVPTVRKLAARPQEPYVEPPALDNRPSRVSLALTWVSVVSGSALLLAGFVGSVVP